jgi:6-pyruvoyltetrahydropterin/6-carboxytetrahydropterin synthase
MNRATVRHFRLGRYLNRRVDLDPTGDLLFRIRVEDSFDASHIIPGHLGKCRNLHGHSYRVEMFVMGDKLDRNGILEGADFAELRKTLGEVVRRYDHMHLNDIIQDNTTAENVAKVIFNELRDSGARGLEKIRVWESPKGYAEYWE